MGLKGDSSKVPLVLLMSNPPEYSKFSDSKIPVRAPYSAAPFPQSPVPYSNTQAPPPQIPNYHSQAPGFPPPQIPLQASGFHPSMMPICSISELGEKKESTYTTCPHCRYTGFTAIDLRVSSILVAIGLILVFADLFVINSGAIFLFGLLTLSMAQSRHHLCSKCNKSITNRFTFRFCCC